MLCHTRTPRLHEYATNVALHMGGGVYALVRAYGQAGARRRWRRAGRAAWVAWWAAGKEGGWTVGAWVGGWGGVGEGASAGRVGKQAGGLVLWHV